MPHKLPPLTPEFSFAGFRFPRYIVDLPENYVRWDLQSSYLPEMFALHVENVKNILRKRLSHTPCGPYYHAPIPNRPSRMGIGFYMASSSVAVGAYTMGDGCIDLRIEEAGGGYSHNDGHTSFSGIVARLPKGRGFLAGWTMGEGMLSCLDGTIYADEYDARCAAKNEAEHACELDADCDSEE